MDSLVGYGSDDENEHERYDDQQSSVEASTNGVSRRREDDTNYDDVNMELSEDSSGESEPELPPVEHGRSSKSSSKDNFKSSDDKRGRDHERSQERSRDRSQDRDRREVRERRRDSSSRSRSDRDRTEKRSPRRDRDDKHKSEKHERSRGSESSSKRGMLGDKPEERSDSKMPALMDLKPFGGEVPPSYRSHDARDAVSPRFVDRDRREKDGGRERDRDRHSRRSEERRSSNRDRDRSEHRSQSRGAAYPPSSSHTSSSSERRGSPPSGDYRPSSYKVNKKLEVMEKMGLQIKTPDGSMATARQLRQAASDNTAHSSGLPPYYNATAVQKRKLLWSNKNKSEAEEAAKWSGTRFAQDQDGKQVSKFMRLMGIKEPAALKPETTNTTADPIKKQEELFQAMQAQYEVARATTHTMRGVGLGFQRGQY